MSLCVHQLAIYPPFAKCSGYRGSFQIALIALAAGCVFLPFSNRITGPIPAAMNVSDTGLGSGDIMNYNTSYHDKNITNLANGTSFCEGFQKTDLVNENSVKRVSLSIWVTLIFGFGLIVLSRQVFIIIFVDNEKSVYLGVYPKCNFFCNPLESVL